MRNVCTLHWIIGLQKDVAIGLWIAEDNSIIKRLIFFNDVTNEEITNQKQNVGEGGAVGWLRIVQKPIYVVTFTPGC